MKYRQPSIRVIIITPARLCDSSDTQFSNSYRNTEDYDTYDLGDLDE